MSKNKKLLLGLITLLLIFNFVFGAEFVLAQTPIPPGGNIEFTNPLTSDDETELLNNILTVLQNVVVTLAIVMIVIGGIMYMASFGNDAAMKRAKAVIASAIIGMAIVLAARTFLQEIWNILGVGGDVPNPDGSDFLTIATRTLNLLLSLVGVIGIIGIVIGGMTYLTAYGDDDRIKLGKKMLTASIIGLAICLSAVIIIRQIMNLIQ